MKPFFVQFYDLISISAPGLPQNLRDAVQRNFGGFVSEDPEKQPKQPDILVLPMERPPAADQFTVNMNHIFGFCVVQYKGRNAVCILDKGNPALCVSMSSSKIEIGYAGSLAGRESMFKSMFFFSLYLALKRKNTMLCHGAAVEKQGDAVVFSGHQGIGKTPVLLYFFHHGWNYVSDDKFFLADEKLFLAEHHIHLKKYHFDIMPWLSRDIGIRIENSLSLQIKRYVGLAVNRFWPGREIPAKAYRYVNPYRRADLNRDRFKGRVAASARPTRWFIFQKGEKFSIQSLSRKRAIHTISLGQKMFFSHMSALEAAFLLYLSGDVPGEPSILDRNLPDMEFARVTFSNENDVNLICERILQSCQ